MKTNQPLTVFSRISRAQLRQLITAALEEDVGPGDLTTELLVPGDLQASAYVLVKAEGVLAGSELFAEVFSLLDETMQVDLLQPDGSRVALGTIVLRLRGRASQILMGERTALNFLQRMSGIATSTSQLVAIASRYGVRVNHIRKTTPLLRALEVYAVRVGGGSYNRFGLFDGILIKDNHLAVAKALGLSLSEVVARCRSGAPHTVKVGLEVKEMAELPDAIRARPDYLALDNMAVAEVKEAVRQVGGSISIDVTGGINAGNLEAIAATGIDMVGVGAITHSAPSLDMSLEVEFHEHLRPTSRAEVRE